MHKKILLAKAMKKTGAALLGNGMYPLTIPKVAANPGMDMPKNHQPKVTKNSEKWSISCGSSFPHFIVTNNSILEKLFQSRLLIEELNLEGGK